MKHVILIRYKQRFFSPKYWVLFEIVRFKKKKFNSDNIGSICSKDLKLVICDLTLFYILSLVFICKFVAAIPKSKILGQKSFYFFFKKCTHRVFLFLAHFHKHGVKIL